MTDQPIHGELIEQIDGGYVVRCKCGRLETWLVSEFRALDAFIEHVKAEVPGIFDVFAEKDQR